jgi:hypothetical protein
MSTKDILQKAMNARRIGKETLLKATNANNFISTSKDSLQRASISFRKALLNYGSETEDNISCAESIEFSIGETHFEDNILGLRLKESGEFLSDFIWSLEDDEVVNLLVKLNPKLSEYEIRAILRINTLIFSAFEADIMKSNK